MAFADLGLRSSGLGIPGAAPDLGTGVWGSVRAAAVAPPLEDVKKNTSRQGMYLQNHPKKAPAATFSL